MDTADVGQSSALPRGKVPSILFVAAEPREFRGVLDLCSTSKALNWPVHWSRFCQWNGWRAFLVANGAGAGRAGAAVSVARSVVAADSIVSTGFCGALENGLAVGDIFVAEAVAGPTRSFPVEMPRSGRPFYSGMLATIDRVAQTVEDKRRIRRSGALAVDMEAAGVAAAAQDWGVPFYCVRAVTDMAEEHFEFNFNAALRSDGHFDTMRILKAAMCRPAVLFPELIRLRSRCRTAARALGEFIADCRF